MKIGVFPLGISLSRSLSLSFKRDRRVGRWNLKGKVEEGKKKPVLRLQVEVVRLCLNFLGRLSTSSTSLSVSEYALSDPEELGRVVKDVL